MANQFPHQMISWGYLAFLDTAKYYIYTYYYCNMYRSCCSWYLPLYPYNSKCEYNIHIYIYIHIFIQLSKIIHMCFSHYIYLYESTLLMFMSLFPLSDGYHPPTNHQVVSGFGPVFASFPNLNLTVAVLVRGPEGPEGSSDVDRKWWWNHPLISGL